jgi:hypothetical protein
MITRGLAVCRPDAPTLVELLTKKKKVVNPEQEYPTFIQRKAYGQVN